MAYVFVSFLCHMFSTSRASEWTRSLAMRARREGRLISSSSLPLKKVRITLSLYASIPLQTPPTATRIKTPGRGASLMCCREQLDGSNTYGTWRLWTAGKPFRLHKYLVWYATRKHSEKTLPPYFWRCRGGLLETPGRGGVRRHPRMDCW